ncbi:hypothetical protein ACO0RG_002508 [Hanseniaspora osmophila]
MSILRSCFSRNTFNPSHMLSPQTRFFSSMLMGSKTSSFTSAHHNSQNLLSATSITSAGTTLESSTNTVRTGSLLFNVGTLLGRRWKTRGNTFQPSVIKRKRKLGFLARNSSTRGRKLLERRKRKGRWYLTY